jgi:hypothetical protein
MIAAEYSIPLNKACLRWLFSTSMSFLRHREIYSDGQKQ